jgi:rhodanese-related sulfurtransferase
MKGKKVFLYLIVALVAFTFSQCKAQKPENWTKDQLMEPAVLANAIKSNKNIPVIYCVGPGVVIPHSINIGMTEDKNNLKKFESSVSQLPRNTNIVIYCGCCPFAKCPNVRPAIASLKEMKFTNYHLLNLPNNIKTDWIARGYPQVTE